MPTRSQLDADEHRRHVGYHGRQAAEHDARGEAEAAAKHRTAAVAHEAAAGRPTDQMLSSAAMRASAIADEVSVRVRRGK